MRKYLVCLIVLVSLLLAFSMNADRRRPVRAGSTNSVEVALSVIYLDEKGFPSQDEKWKYCWVSMDSMRPLTYGTTFSFSVQKPGESNFIFLKSWTVEINNAGGYVAYKVYLQDGFYDTLPSGAKQDWLPGIAIFKVDIVTAKGERTSVSQKVPVRLDGLRVPLGPFQQAVPSADGKSVLFIGVFPTPPTAMLFHFFEDGSYVALPVPVSQNQFVVPSGMSGLGSPVTGITGYPDAESSTLQVDIPAVSQNKSLFSFE